MSDFFVGFFCFFCRCFSYKKFENTRMLLCEAEHIIKVGLLRQMAVKNDGRKYYRSRSRKIRGKMVDEKGIEPSTPALRTRCSPS